MITVHLCSSKCPQTTAAAAHTATPLLASLPLRRSAPPSSHATATDGLHPDAPKQSYHPVPLLLPSEGAASPPSRTTLASSSDLSITWCCLFSELMAPPRRPSSRCACRSFYPLGRFGPPQGRGPPDLPSLDEKGLSDPVVPRSRGGWFRLALPLRAASADN
ncbi:hypothetical protein E2562_012456 [Oryza meyeriana var. granulata]|uniref:Uncharacterized protein n=1 Tax=Oryza meyeriana var. granulata TaxID=110450 RepID=A0A6G1C5D0_9ORYZ|nr:hypothetical protein E2562_012456 [Oryza meyeriana var. granulata]KAF0895450.1 hypothetical protein E2562_012456 [Oryza meyeriana var. granulata]